MVRLPSPMWVEGRVLCVCMCVCVLFAFKLISKSRYTTSHRLGNLLQKVVLYKTGKFFQTTVAQMTFKLETALTNLI